MAKVKTDVVILSKLASWDQWYEDTKASVSSQMWKYFDPDSDATLTKPVEPVMQVDGPSYDRNEPPQVQNARITETKGMKMSISSSSKFLGRTKGNETGTTKSTPSLENAFSQR